MSIIGRIVRSISERNARGKSYADFQRALTKTGDTIHGRFETASDTPGHRGAGRHIIGIENWAQSRLRVALGNPYQQDEYDGYQPAEDLDMPALSNAFADARADTVMIAQLLEKAAVPLSQTVPHNDMGDLTIGGWLSYIIAHAGRESRRL